MSDVNGTVVAIQGRDVDSAAPNDGDTFRWNASTSKWEPVAPPQPLEPWVGTPNTQAQIIKRIPWMCSLVMATGPVIWYPTGVTLTVPTDRAVAFFIYSVSRRQSSPVSGAVANAFLLSIANNGGTLTSTTSPATAMGSDITGTFLANPWFRLATSGTTATLEIAFANASGLAVDAQGYVDLIIN
jgi:hypothetical protein